VGRIIDVSLRISPQLLTWPGDPPIEIQPRSLVSEGDTANVSQLRFSTHTGTHIDPPFHFLKDGAAVDEVPLEALVGEAIVVDFGDVSGQIGPPQLEAAGLPEGVKRVLFKTRNSWLWRKLPIEFPDEFVSLSPDGADWIVKRGIRLVGIDFLGIEARGAPGHPTHKKLLEAEVVIVEGLDLFHVEAGKYELVCLPLLIEGGDGAPARAILIQG
jgi:arylformamidase